WENALSAHTHALEGVSGRGVGQVLQDPCRVPLRQNRGPSPSRLIKKRKEYEVNQGQSKKYSVVGIRPLMKGSLMLACASLLFSGAGKAQNLTSQDKESDVVHFKLAVVPQFADCLRASRYEEPKVRGTIIHGKQVDTLILDMDGIKPNLTLSIFSNERTFFTSAGTKDPNFHGFGLSWYQGDISTGKRSDDGHVRIQTILSDETFGFDADANLAPTNAYHIGIWFDDPETAVSCGFVPNPDKPQPFNGEHNSGPLAFETVPDENGVGPVCPHSNPGANGQPGTCGEEALPAVRLN